MKKKFSKVLLTLILIFSMTKNVYGNSVTATGLFIFDESGSRVYKNVDGTQRDLVQISIKDNATGETFNGYCIDVGATLTSSGEHTTGQSLFDYLNSFLNDETKTKNVIKKINEYNYFGYGYNNQNNYKYYIATQKLIWDELYNAGYRQEYYGTNVTFTSSQGTIDITNEINTIKNSISNYYKTPSFCSNQSKIEIAVGETATYTDNNNVLSNYNITCSDSLSCKKEGNTLKVTATKEGSEQKINFSKTIEGENLTLFKQENRQSVIANKGQIEPISCDFGIDTYKNVQTSDTKIIYVITIGLFCGTIAYIMYYTKKTLNGFK